MKRIVIGLGNPGVDYLSTRHNAGMMLVDEIGNSVQAPACRQAGIASSYGWRRKKNVFVFEIDDLVLMKGAGVFMNESEKIIRELDTKRYSLDAIYVAHDDLDLKLGEYKIQFGKGPKEHNGVNSIERALGTKDFWRIRIGIDSRVTHVDGEAYVLQKFSGEEKIILDRVLNEICKTNFGRKE